MWLWSEWQTRERASSRGCSLFLTKASPRRRWGRLLSKASGLSRAFAWPFLESNFLQKYFLQVRQHMRERLSEHKQPLGGVCFLDSIPKSASGKILRRELRQQILTWHTSANKGIKDAWSTVDIFNGYRSGLAEKLLGPRHNHATIFIQTYQATYSPG